MSGLSLYAYSSVNAIRLPYEDTCTLSWIYAPLYLKSRNTVAYINHNFEIEKYKSSKGSLKVANLITHMRLEAFIRNSLISSLKKDDPRRFNNDEMLERLSRRVVDKMIYQLDLVIADELQPLTFGKIRRLNRIIVPLIYKEIKESLTYQGMKEKLSILDI